MRTSTEIYSIAKHIGEERAVELVAKSGFDGWDFSMFDMCKSKRGILIPENHITATDNYLAFARKLRQIGLDNGIVCNQGHAPFPSSPRSIYYLKRAIECVAEAGGDICVIHPMNNGSARKNAKMYFEILDFAKEHKVKIATENMWNWNIFRGHSSFAACATPGSFNAHLDAVNDDFFVACLDIGHAEMKGSNTSAAEMIKKLGNRLKALHIHDNDKLHDSHQIPFSMNIDFESVAKALKEIGYDGYLTLEASGYLEKMPEENIASGVKDLYNSVRRLSDMIEK